LENNEMQGCIFSIYKKFVMAEILIIDDEKAIRKTLGEILGFEGYKID